MSAYETLSKIDVNSRTEKKQGLTYLSWAWAWAEVKKACPDASYKVIDFDGKPYLHDEILGYMVATEVTIAGETLPMHLPVMDGANQAMKSTPYQYKVKSGMKDVKAATMFDINKATMRCLVKNLAMFGLGLYIYAGEDLPDGVFPMDENAKSWIDAVKNDTAALDQIQDPDYRLFIKEKAGL